MRTSIMNALYLSKAFKVSLGKCTSRQLWKRHFGQNIAIRTFVTQRKEQCNNKERINDAEPGDGKKRSASSSSGNMMAFAFKALFASPLIFLFGAVMFGQSRQGYEVGTLPEQYQFFRRYICANAQLLDELGAPLKITAGSTDIEIQNEDELKFSFGIQGDYGKGIVHCHRIIKDITNGTESNVEFEKETKLQITVITQTDLGSDTVGVIDKISYE